MRLFHRWPEAFQSAAVVVTQTKHESVWDRGGTEAAPPCTGEQSHRCGKLPSTAKWHWVADNQIINHRSSLNSNQSGGNRPRSSWSSQCDWVWRQHFNSQKTEAAWSFFISILLNLYSTRKKNKKRLRWNPIFTHVKPTHVEWVAPAELYFLS